MEDRYLSEYGKGVTCIMMIRVPYDNTDITRAAHALDLKH